MAGRPAASASLLLQPPVASARPRPRLRLRPQLRPRAAHVVPLSFNNNFIGVVEHAEAGAGPVPMAMDAPWLREAGEAPEFQTSATLEAP